MGLAITQGEFALTEQAMRTFVMLYDTRGWLQEGLDTLAAPSPRWKRLTALAA